MIVDQGAGHTPIKVSTMIPFVVFAIVLVRNPQTILKRLRKYSHRKIVFFGVITALRIELLSAVKHKIKLTS